MNAEGSAKPAPVFLTTEQLATRYGVAEITIKLWRARGVGPRFIKIGRLIRYAIKDLEAYEAALPGVG